MAEPLRDFQPVRKVVTDFKPVRRVSAAETKPDPPEPPPFELDAVFDEFGLRDFADDPAGFKNDVSLSLAPLTRPFIAQGYNSLSALNRGFASLLTHLDSISEYVSAKTGMEKSGILGPDALKKVADFYNRDADYWGKRAGETGINFIDELVSEALGGAMPGIAEFMMNVPYSAALGAAEAYRKEESEIAGALVEGAKRGVLGAMFHALAPLRKYLQAPLMGATFAVQTGAEGGDRREVAKSFGTGALYALTTPGGRLGLNELKTDLGKALAREEAKRIPRTEPAVDVEEPPVSTPAPEPIAQPGPPGEAAKALKTGERQKEAPTEDPEYYFQLETKGIPKAEDLGEKPSLTIFAGPTGAGKTTMLGSSGPRMETIVNINSDIVKDWAGQLDNPEFHEASSRIAKENLNKAQAEGYNVLYDSTLGNYTYAREIIENTLEKGGPVQVIGSDIDVLTSVVRAAWRKESAFEKGLTPRIIPEAANIDSYNRFLPTFRRLFEDYKENPRVDFDLFDNNTDWENAVHIFSHQGGKTTVFDQKLFDKFLNLEYIKSEAGEGGKEVRYERREKADQSYLDAHRQEIQRRILEGRYRRSLSQLQALAPAAGIQAGQQARELSTPPRPGAEPDQSPQIAPSDTSVDRGKFPVERVRVSEIKTKPEELQFKLDVNAEGEQKPLKGEWNELAAGNLLLWQAADGTYYVANGHHRLALAKRTGQEAVNAQILKEGDGYTIADARRVAAEANILAGKGTIYDQAEYFRTSPGYTEDLSTKKGLVGAGYTIGKKATDNTYAQFRNKKISPEAAEAIADAAPKNDNLQVAGVDFALKNPKADAYEISNFINALTISTEAPVQQGNLFGFNDRAIEDAKLQAKAVAQKMKELREQVNAVRGAAKRPEIAKKLGVDVKDPQAVKSKVTELSGELARWEKWYTFPELVDEIRQATGTKRKPKPAAEPAKEEPGPALLKLNPKEIAALKLSEADARILEKMEKENPDEFARLMRGNTAAMVALYETRRKERGAKMAQGGLFEKPAQKSLFYAPKEGGKKEPPSGQEGKGEEPVSRGQILKFLEEKLDVPIRTGRIMERALGVFKPFENVIRSKKAADLETISHEVGHVLHKFLWPEKFYGLDMDAPFLPFKGELRDLSFHLKDTQYPLSEGFSEFIRLYITNPTIGETLAPNFHAYFEKTIKEKAPESQEVLLEARKMYEKYLRQPALSRVRSQISIGEDQPKKTSLDDLYTLALDEFHPLKTIEQKMAGKELPEVSDSPYHLARLLNGWLGKANAFLRNRPFEYSTYKDSGKGLEDILRPFKEELEDLSTYMVARRVLKLDERAIETGINVQDAEAVVKQLDPKYAKAFDELQEYQGHLLKYLRDSGILSQELYEKIEKVSKDYDPFYRVFEEGGGGGGLKKGLQAYQPIKEIKGSWERIQDPIESIIKNTLLYINLAERNAVGRALVDLGTKKEGRGKFLEEIPTPVYPEQIKPEEIFRPSEIKMMKAAGINIQEFYTVFRPSAFTPRHNVISVWIDGVQRDFQVPNDVYRTFQALDREGANTIEKLISYPAKMLRAGSVLTPEFIARNPFRDQFNAFIQSRYGFIPGVDLIRGVFHLLKKDELYWNWQKSGGAQATLASMDREYFQQELGKILQDSPVLNLVTHPVEALRVLGEIGEVGTRLGEFSRGVKKEGAEKPGLQAAGYSSREITTDFQRIGAKTRAINGIISFWNANVQGPDRLIREFRENPGPATLKALAAITLPSILLAWANHDDPRYKEVPQWQKDLFWIVIPDHMSNERWDEMTDQEKSEHLKWISGSIWRFPKPWELGLVFGTVPERAFNYALDRDPEAWNKLGETLYRAVTPGVIPTFLVPWLENKANYSFFFDRKVVPASREDLPPQYQYAPYTTEAAKKLGEVLGKMPYIEKTDFASPAKVENLIRGWTGGLGYYALQLVSEGLTRTGLAEEGPPKPEKTFADIPLLKAFAVRYPQGGAESVQDFYDHYKEAAGIEKSIATMAREFKYEKAMQILVEDYSGSLKGHYQAISILHDMIEMTYNHPEMTPEEKREFIDISYFQMIQIAHNGNEMIKDLKRIMEENRREKPEEPVRLREKRPQPAGSGQVPRFQ